ncbi:MAG: metalloregulator ArsR/SmtB family transcription factor [Oscillospiraceae bacterium]|nr:metalloregulator ArsR/SmtB family transcription factor [Oscillospiraceae bacterium]
MYIKDKRTDAAVCDCDAIHAEKVLEVNAKMPDAEQFCDLADLYKVFSDSTRIRILWALNCSEMCVCDLAVLLNMTKSAISHQLKLLRIANLVKNTRQGKIVFYRLADEHVREIFEKGMEHINE